MYSEGESAMKKREMTRRELLRGSAMITVGVLAAACAPAAPAPPAQAPAPATQATETPQAAAATAEAVTVKLWCESTGADLDAFCMVGTNFEASKSDLGIKVDCTGFDDLSKVAAATAAGDPPDLVQSWERMNVPGMYQQGGVLPLDPYIDVDKFDTSIVLPGALEGCRTYDGTYFAFPFMCYAGSNFFWNTKLFQDKGLDPTKPPETLEDLMSVGEKFDVYDGDKLMKVGFHPRYAFGAETWCFAFGGKFYDPTKQQITPQDQGVEAGLNWLLSYATKYGADNLDRLAAAYGSFSSANNAFLAGEVAMTAFWDALPAYRDRYAPDVQMAFSSFPYPTSMTDQKGFGKLDFNPCFIPKGAKYADQAWKLLRFIEEDIPSNIEIAVTLANTPQNVNAITSPQNNASPLLKQVQEYASGPKMQIFPPSIPVAAQYATEWNRQVDLIFHGQISVDDGMKKVYDTVQPDLDKALKGG
jgi:multiple sugar transport system substrate-binding protein